MENIEHKLNEYRVRKRRQETIQRFKKNLKGFLMLGVKDKHDTNEVPDKTAVTIHDSDPDDNFHKKLCYQNNVDNDDGDDVVLSSEDDTIAAKIEEDSQCSTPENRVLKYTLWVVYFAFWVTLYIIAIELQFGIVFLMFSALFGIYLNTRTGPRKRNEISAYSVFNKNCESIDGTLKAEQFEREIGIRHKTSI